MPQGLLTGWGTQVKETVGNHSSALPIFLSSSTCNPTVNAIPYLFQASQRIPSTQPILFFLTFCRAFTPHCARSHPRHFTFQVIILPFAISCCSFNFSSEWVKNCLVIFLKGKRRCQVCPHIPMFPSSNTVSCLI